MARIQKNYDEKSYAKSFDNIQDFIKYWKSTWRSYRGLVSRIKSNQILQ